MKKAFLRTAAFLLATALLLGGAGWCFVPKDNRWLSGYKGGGVFGLRPGELDILVLGSSNAAQGVSPAEWWGSHGWTGHSYGEAWLNVYKAAEVLALVLAEQSPQVVLVETDMLFSAPHPQNETETFLASLAENIFSLLRWHNRWKEIKAPADLFAPRDWSWRHDHKGYELVVGKSPYTGGDYMQPNPADRSALYPQQSLTLEAMAALCRARGSRMVLFSVPAAEGWNLTRSRAVSEWAAAHGVAFWDLNLEQESIGFDWAADTPDGGAHLNLSGARKVTAALAEKLAACRLPDHRGEEAYAAWEQEYQTYRGDCIYAEQNLNG